VEVEKQLEIEPVLSMDEKSAVKVVYELLMELIDTMVTFEDYLRNKKENYIFIFTNNKFT
jgi:hypothetical protein